MIKPHPHVQSVKFETPAPFLQHLPLQRVKSHPKAYGGCNKYNFLSSISTFNNCYHFYFQILSLLSIITKRRIRLEVGGVVDRRLRQFEVFGAALQNRFQPIDDFGERRTIVRKQFPTMKHDVVAEKVPEKLRDYFNKDLVWVQQKTDAISVSVFEYPCHCQVHVSVFRSTRQLGQFPKAKPGDEISDFGEVRLGQVFQII